MIETITYHGATYPALQAQGFAAQYAFPFAYIFCNGIGFDIGCMRLSWKFPGSIPIDPALNEYDAMNLPSTGEALISVDKVDYIFSSHCLEHLSVRIGDVLEYWLSRVKKGGVIFLYLPNCDYQQYWAFGNRKHIHYVNPTIMKGVCHELECSSYFVTEGWDLNGSFYCVIEK